jgi:hypothetical protein
LGRIENKLLESGFGRSGKIIIAVAPGKLKSPGVESVVRKDEALALGVGEPVLHEGEIQIRVATVNLVPHDGMADMGEVESDLMFAASEGAKSKQREGNEVHFGGWFLFGIFRGRE